MLIRIHSPDFWSLNSCKICSVIRWYDFPLYYRPWRPSQLRGKWRVGTGSSPLCRASSSGTMSRSAWPASPSSTPSSPHDLDFRYSIVGSSRHPTTWTSSKVWAGLKEVERAGFHVQYNGLDFMLKGLDFTHKGLNFVYRGWTWCTMGWISCTVGWTSLIKGCTYKGRDFMYKSNYLRVLTWGYLVRRLQRCLWQLCRL